MQYGQTVLVLRRLLARIRDVMAANGSAQTRLARIVSIIAKDMATEVCSIYVRRAGDVLELFATQGLRATAVRRTRLRVGEGLIGEIAAKGRPLALTDAQSHPNFAFRPETGEEIYHSLMGVPILRGGRVVGVLAVQNVNARQYTDEEIEALQTVAMVLAELVASGDLVGRDELSPMEGLSLSPMRLEGARLNAGLGIGVAVLHKHQFTIRRLVAEDTRVEHDRLRKAVAEMHGALDNMLRASASRRYRRAPRSAGDVPADRRGRRLAQTYRRCDQHRADRRGGGPEGQRRYSCEDATGLGFLLAGTRPRSGGSRQSLAAALAARRRGDC